MRFWGILIQILMMTTILIRCQRSSTLVWDDQLNQAYGCIFQGKELRSVFSQGHECRDICNNETNCTHYAYFSNRGICHLKFGRAVRAMAIISSNQSDICGII